MKLFDIRKKHALPDAADALPGRSAELTVTDRHRVLDAPLRGPFPGHLSQVVLGMGCFWGVERLFWTIPGVYTTAVGYAGGHTPNATYEEVCSGRTGHTEAVLVVFDATVVTLEELLKVFWEGHDPTQGMRQGNDLGTQYRSAVYLASDDHKIVAEQTRAEFQERLTLAGFGEITTEIAMAGPFYYAEDYHQQYLDKNPGGYCGLSGTGVSCPVGLAAR